MAKDIEDPLKGGPPLGGPTRVCNQTIVEEEKISQVQCDQRNESDSSALEIKKLSNLPVMIECEKAFSSSLPALLHKKATIADLLNDSRRTIKVEEAEDTASEQLDHDEQTIRDLLPDEEELFSDIVEGFDMMSIYNNTTEEAEDYDLFSSGGGMELDSDSRDNLGSQFDGSRGSVNGFSGPSVYQAVSSGITGCIIGEHPFGEHPSRTLFVRNINSNVEDAELRALFEHYGAIRTLYTACKHRGFVMISYYDIRSARNAMRALQNKPLRRRKLDIHFSIPKDNPSDKDINQGTLVVFNLEASVSNEELRQIFGQYGEVKEIRETPHKRHHKFIEFYDVRAAEAALKALNRSDIAGKRIKLEPSRPGGARRSFVQQHGPEADQDDSLLYGFSSPVPLSPPGNVSSWTQFGSPLENSPIRTLHSTLRTMTPSMDKLAAASGSLQVGAIGSHLSRRGSIDSGFSPAPPTLGAKGTAPYRAHSLPNYSSNQLPFLKPRVPIPMGSAGLSGNSFDALESLQLPMSAATGDGSSTAIYEHKSGAMMVPGGGSMRHLGSPSLSGQQFLWPQSASNQPIAALNGWPGTPPMSNHLHSSPHAQPRSFMYTGAQEHNPVTLVQPHRYHLGSAPSGTFGALGNVGSPSSVLSTNVHTAHTMISPGNIGPSSRRSDGGSPSLGLPPHRRNVVFQTAVLGGIDGHGDRGRIRRREHSGIQVDGNKQYQLDIERILRGEDARTTLMIKNIPNKYTSKMLLAAIDENHRKTYDFLYLPIDFKNKCNVGYAFINMTSPGHIVPFYQAFNGKKWEKFNSEKVASLAYARIQGKAALVAHFQNSSLMNEDKRCRPILFDSDLPDANEQEQATLGRSMRDGWRDSDGISEFIDELKRQSSFGEHSLRLDSFPHVNAGTK